MNFIDLLNTYSSEIFGLISTIMTAVLAYVGAKIKTALEKNARKKEIEAVIQACVGLAERQIPKLSGTEKYEFAAAKASEWLATKGIVVSEVELEIQIEKACNAFMENAGIPVEPKNIGTQDMVSVDKIKDLIEEGEVDNVYDEDN